MGESAMGMFEVKPGTWNLEPRPKVGVIPEITTKSKLSGIQPETLITISSKDYIDCNNYFVGFTFLLF